MCSSGHFFKDLKHIELENEFREVLKRFLAQYETIETLVITPKVKENNVKVNQEV